MALEQYSVDFECLGCGATRTMTDKFTSARKAIQAANDLQETTRCVYCEGGIAYIYRQIERKIDMAGRDMSESIANRIKQDDYSYDDLVRSTYHHASNHVCDCDWCKLDSYVGVTPYDNYE